MGHGPQGLSPVIMPMRGGGSGVLWHLPCSPRRGLPHTVLSLREGLALGEPLALRQPLLFLFLLGPVPPACLSPELALLQDQVGLVGLCWPGAAARLGPWAAVSPCCVWRAPCIAAPSSCQLPLDHCSSWAGWLGTPPSPLQAQPLGFIRPSPAQDTTAAWVNHIHGMG